MDDRLLRGAVAPISVTVTAAGEPVEADGPPLVTIRREDGSVVLAGVMASAGEETGVYELVLDAEQTDRVDVLEATWTASVDGAAAIFSTTHEVVGGFMTSVEAIRDALPNMSAEPSTADIERARTLAEDWLEDECGVAFRPRYGHDRLDGSGTIAVLLSRPQVIAVRRVAAGGEEVAEGWVFYPSGELRSTSAPWAAGAQNLDVIYEHGYPTVPSRVGRAATLLARYFLVPNPSDYDGRATSISTETAHYTLITPGVREAITAIPEVNVVMENYDFTSAVVG